ncbi:DUF4469 domain-containing protein [Candidatus Electrothrix sp.]|uniref:DUF4469 domain-containing protein n=1 Tax=Candidatus Electrothrix sp. TaxID=2170559 RepID=UPI0040578FA2
MAIHYRIERNALTKPGTWRLRFLPQGIAGYDEVAERVALKNPGSSVEQVKTHLQSGIHEILGMVLEGIQVTLEDAMTFRPAFHARLSTPDSSLPPLEELLGLNIAASRSLVRELQAEANLVREPWTEKVPTIQAAADTVTRLNNVLNPEGVLRLTGNNLAFDTEDPESRCVLAGTESGSEEQSQFAEITEREVLVVPRIPVQSHPWNNEYTVSITTRYTEHGSIRTGTYGGRLRTPLEVPLSAMMPPPETGILTGSAATPYVVIMGGPPTGDERLRVQVEHNLQDDLLSFRLIDMRDGGTEGLPVPVTGNGVYILPGFTGSAVSSLDIRVDDYTALKTMVLNDYAGSLVDILDVRMA